MIKQMIVMCGLPRSGKSTWVNEYHDGSFQVICADDIRLALGTQFFKPLENFVWGVHDTAIAAALERGYSVIIDSCNTTVASLRKYQDIASKYEAEFWIYWVDTPLDVCLKRNEGPGAVPQKVILRMNEQLEILKESFFWKYDCRECIVPIKTSQK